MRRLLALLLVLPSAMRAQTLDSAHLRHKADSLLRLYQDAITLARVEVAVTEAREQRAATVTRSTAAIRGEHPIQAGGLMVIANQPDSIPLREAVPRSWAALRQTYGSRAESLTARPVRLIVYHADRNRTEETAGRRVPAGIAPDLLERAILGEIGAPRADARLSRWLGGGVHVLLDTADARSATYLELVTGGEAARACFRGDVPRCGETLQLNEDSAFYLTVFNAVDRREAVIRARDPAMLTQVSKPQYDRCVAGSDSACVAFLRGLGPDQVPRPLDGNGRSALVSTALAMGGDSAYDRLVHDTTAAIVSRLEAAARAPIGTVVSRWRREVLAARPPRPSVPFRDAAFSIGWIALLVAGSVRSTRWRLA